MSNYMQLFFHDVGKKGADTDFPKTIYNDLLIQDLIPFIHHDSSKILSNLLLNEFKDGKCNIWGVPSGASSVIRQLKKGDVMLLIRTTGGDGDIPILCKIQVFWNEPLFELSRKLWGSERFPYIFFFKTQKIKLTWVEFCDAVKYKSNFRPSGNVYRIRSDRLEEIGGIEQFLNSIQNNKFYTTNQEGINLSLSDNSSIYSYEEGERYFKEVSFFKRNTSLVNDAKKNYGYICQACGFDFYKSYGEIGSNYIECHHLDPLSEREEELLSTINDVCVLCANCHRMIHRKKPPYSLQELKSIINNNIYEK